jgi:hypothetical protein
MDSPDYFGSPYKRVNSTPPAHHHLYGILLLLEKNRRKNRNRRKNMIPTAALPSPELVLQHWLEELAEHPGDVVGLATLLGHTSLDTTRISSQPMLSPLATRMEQLHHNADATSEQSV